MSRKRSERLNRAYRFARSMQRQVAARLKENIVAGVDGSGEEFLPMWADNAVFPNGLQSDRAGEPVLIESGALLRSVRPGRIVREGNRLVCYLKAKPYGLEQHRGFTEQPPVVIGRTHSLRERIRNGNFGRIPRGDKVTMRRPVKVPARPWISIDRDSVEHAMAVAKSGGG